MRRSAAAIHSEPTRRPLFTLAVFAFDANKWPLFYFFFSLRGIQTKQETSFYTVQIELKAAIIQALIYLFDEIWFHTRTRSCVRVVVKSCLDFPRARINLLSRGWKRRIIFLFFRCIFPPPPTKNIPLESADPAIIARIIRRPPLSSTKTDFENTKFDKSRNADARK